MRPRLATMATALWWGSLSGLGFVVVPMLFAQLGSPAIAGAMAAKLFSAQTWVGVACAMLVLMSSSRKDDPAMATASRTLMKWVIAGLFLAVLVEFGVSPRIANARVEGGNLKLWHGLGTAMYIGQWLCAGWALWISSRRTD